MSDLISREGLLKQIEIDSNEEPGYYGDTWKFIDTIKNMPSAQPKKHTEKHTETHACDCISRQAAIDVDGLDEEISCEMCENPMHTDRGCDGNCEYDEILYEKIIQILNKRITPLPSAQPEIVRCKDCKHQVKEWRDDKRLKEKGYWVYGCKVISDICGYWAWFGQDDEFCSAAERRTDE